MELGKLKGLLGIPETDTSQDVSLRFILEDVEGIILDYCCLEEMPPGLVHTAYRMAVDLYRGEKPGQDSGPVMVSSISEGNTSTSFTNAFDALNGGVLKDYQGQLNRYRKLRW